MPARWKCIKCNIVLSGEGASRHYLSYPKHRLHKLEPRQAVKYSKEVSTLNNTYYYAAVSSEAQ